MISQGIFETVCTISSPAKAILCGEHAVVYGKDAIAMGIGLYCKGIVQLRKKNNQACIVVQSEAQSLPIVIESQALYYLEEKLTQSYSFDKFQHDLIGWSHSPQLSKSQFARSIHYKISLFLNLEGLKWKEWSKSTSMDWKVIIKSEIPISKCLGSSAAFNTVLSTSLLQIFGILPKGLLTIEIKEKINSISMQFEKVEHGNPSGIDNYVSVNGGVILYNKNKSPRFQKLEKSASNIKQFMKIGVFDSGIEKNTKVAVERVKAKYQAFQKARDQIDQIGIITSQIMAMLETSQFNQQSVLSLLKLTSYNHVILRELGVSHQKIEQIVEKLEKEQWSAKITGSGMGGCVLLLSSKSKMNHSEVQLTPLDQNGLQIYFNAQSKAQY